MRTYNVEILLAGSSNRIVVNIRANSRGLAAEAVKKMYPNCKVLKIY
ncbi:MAG: hypothetical protein PHX84_02050 [Candidatus Shapirobacteria bacterium]|nr:hypothetical protein [Candidatus Shapirobacteria bacterium]